VADDPEPEPAEPEYTVENHQRFMFTAPIDPPYVKVDDDGTVWIWRHGFGQYVKTKRWGDDE
jgi:hypothetical protein